ncbi:MAG: tetraacyldisaccharide 4'-kinase [Algoriphagus sp.]|jgi:tetraacyldisaccharide 4'-kinase
MRWYAFLLYPFALVYDLVTSLRNFFFEIGLLNMKKSAIPSIVVGNLSVGGTGKTPMIEFLIRLLIQNYQIATLSRGYGRNTKGFLRADISSKPNDIGDEPYQIFTKFDSKVSVFVGEDRVAAAHCISQQAPDSAILLLDDAFQHRYFKSNLSILLTTYSKPFVDDYLLPVGRLRESRKGASRADVVLVTKSPIHLESEKKADLVKKIRKVVGNDTPVLFSSIIYGKPYGLNPDFDFSNEVILFSGLANNQSLRNFVLSNYNLQNSFSFPDHYSYNSKDFEDLRESFKSASSKKVVLLTTEKDAGKVKSSAPEGFLAEIPIFVLPIEVAMVKEDLVILEKLIQFKVLNKGRNQ